MDRGGGWRNRSPSLFFIFYSSHSQNSVSFGNGFEKSVRKSAFPSKSKVAFPKTEVLGKPHSNDFLTNPAFNPEAQQTVSVRPGLKT
jgi:hypothetical protein